MSAPAAASSTQNVLLLGMAFVTAEYAAAAQRTADVGTTSAPARDRARLLQLQAAHSQMHLITLNQDIDANHCMAKQHVRGAFGQRVAKELRDTFGDSFVFHRIFLDYFRFPSEYMRGAYSSFLKEMLPKLVGLGLFGVDSQLVVPNLPELLDSSLRGIKFERPASLMEGQAAASTTKKPTTPCYLRFDPLAAADYPLYAATDLISADTLGGYSNSQEIAQLDKDSPFIRVRLTDVKSS